MRSLIGFWSGPHCAGHVECAYAKALISRANVGTTNFVAEC